MCFYCYSLQLLIDYYEYVVYTADSLEILPDSHFNSNSYFVFDKSLFEYLHRKFDEEIEPIVVEKKNI